MCYELLQSSASFPEKIMETDAALLQSLIQNPRVILHFYEWETPSATYGYFLDPNLYFNRTGLQKHALRLARRPTGGWHKH